MKNMFRWSPRQKIVAGLIICLLAALACYTIATAMIDSLYAYRSPLDDNPPQPTAPLGRTTPRKVVFVLIDGLRYDSAARSDLMSVLNGLRPAAAVAKMHSRPPSYSEPGYSTLLTGAWPALNGGPAVNLDYADIPTITQDTLFSAAHRAGLRTAVAGYFWFEKLLPQAAISDSFYTSGEDHSADRAVVDAALPWLEQDVSLLLIHIDQVDYAGHHEGGPHSPAGEDAARRADALLGEILAKIDLTQDALLVVSDHGHIPSGGHGGIERDVLTEPFLLTGKGVLRGDYGDVQMVDVAPTLAVLLGVNLPASAQGQPLTQLLALPQPVSAALPAAIAAQQTRLLEAYTQAINRPLSPSEMPTGTLVADFQARLHSVVEERLYLERGSRWAAVGFAALLVVGVITRFRRRALGWSFGGAALSLVLFHLRYAVLDGHPYSLSWVTGQNDLLVYVALTAAISSFIGWLAAMLGQGAFKQAPTSAMLTSLGFVLALLTLLALPFGVSFALNGLTITWILPEFLSYFIAFLTLLQALFSSLAGLLLLAVAALIARQFSRATPANAR